ncbi:hypothetical protein [Mesorhizobium sp.]|uniref:hypothetical protein n=1 Tax=Mesorhizobium sp. TaxID=1871066 RepID=UPI00257E02D4|nr:hypothetical protein [Mesorhizobium sp.]
MIAAQRPEMRFVEPRTEEQQARAVLFRSRERLVHQRTELVNALRAALYEYGHAVPQGIGQLKRIEAIVEAPNSDLPELVREECLDLLDRFPRRRAGSMPGRRRRKNWQLRRTRRAVCKRCLGSAH